VHSHSHLHHDDSLPHIHIPDSYRAPRLDIADYETPTANNHYNMSMSKIQNPYATGNYGGNMLSGPGGYAGGGKGNDNIGNNGFRGPESSQQQHSRGQQKLFHIVTFKCSRAGVYYTLKDTGLELKVGDNVIVEADRGSDLGVIHHVDVAEDKFRILLKKYAQEQHAWLVNGAMIVRRDQGNNPLLDNATAKMQGEPREPPLRPKAVKRLATSSDLALIPDKEGKEARATRHAQDRVNEIGLTMKILDCEWQM